MRITILSMLFVLLLTSCYNKPTTITLYIQVKGIPDSTSILLMEGDDDAHDAVAKKRAKSESYSEERTKMKLIREKIDSLSPISSLHQYEIIKKRKTFNDVTLSEYCDIVQFGILYGDFLKPYIEEVKTKYNSLSDEMKNS